MVTVAIIGILAAVAVPAYQDYTIRSQVTEGLSLLSGAKVKMEEQYSLYGKVRGTTDVSRKTLTDMGIWTENLNSNYIISIIVEPYPTRLTAIFGNKSSHKIHNGSLSLTPYETEKGNLLWRCESTLEQKYLPNSCQHFNMAMRMEKRKEFEPNFEYETHDDGTVSWSSFVPGTLEQLRNNIGGWCTEAGVHLDNYVYVPDVNSVLVTCRTDKIGK